jgi:hypothetical protein
MDEKKERLGEQALKRQRKCENHIGLDLLEMGCCDGKRKVSGLGLKSCHGGLCLALTVLNLQVLLPESVCWLIITVIY